MFKKQKTLFLLIVIVVFGAFLRFYKLDWGGHFYFHPDERNIASLISTLDQKQGLDFWLQGTFSYGSLLTYIIYFIELAVKRLNLCAFSFECSTLLLRFFSALFSSITIYVVYKIGSIWEEKIGLYASIIVAFAPGLIQAAHFGTFESILTLLYIYVFWFCLNIVKQSSIRYVLLAVILITTAGSLKINSFIFLPIPLLLYGAKFFIDNRKPTLAVFIKKILLVIAVVMVEVLLVFLFSPYYLTNNFRGMFTYERSLVTGVLDVFYTRQFAHTNITFPFTHIFPFIINPFVLIFFLCFFIAVIPTIFKKREGLIILSFCLVCIPNALIYTKWTRYFMPTIPFLALGTAIFLSTIEKKNRFLGKVLIVFVVITSFLYGFAFFAIYQKSDSRIIASEWIYNNIPKDAIILSETGNVIDIPVPLKEYNNTYIVRQFDFYNVETNEKIKSELFSELARSDYIFIPSRRIFMAMGSNGKKYPFISKYYQHLFDGTLGFKQIKEIHSYPTLEIGPPAGGLKLEIPDEQAEETWSVFDHPVIRIFKKNKIFTTENYEKLLQK